jgi:hypothetical protein
MSHGYVRKRGLEIPVITNKYVVIITAISILHKWLDEEIPVALLIVV